MSGDIIRCLLMKGRLKAPLGACICMVVGLHPYLIVGSVDRRNLRFERTVGPPYNEQALRDLALATLPNCIISNVIGRVGNIAECSGLETFQRCFFAVDG